MKIKTKHFLLVLSPLFFAVITLLLTFSVDSVVIITLLSSVLHELGHLILLVKYGCKIKSVTLSYYGMKIIRENEISLDFGKEIAVCLSGVTVNLVISILFTVFYLTFKNQFLLKVSVVNLILGLFNLLPVGLLDGARALSCFLKYRFDLSKSEKMLKAISICVLIPIIILSFFLLKLNGNFTLLICSVYLAVSTYSLSY